MLEKELNQFYTKDEIALQCLNLALETLSKLNSLDNALFLETSAGAGAFIRALKQKNISNFLAYDIDPKADYIKKKNFLNDDFSFLKNHQNIITIGNPPYAKKAKVAIEFINKAFEYSNTICFILPVQFNKFSAQKQINSKAKLIFNQLLPNNSFTFKDKEYSIRTAFQIWTLNDYATKDFRIKQAPPTTHKDFEIWQYNCTKEALKYFDKELYQWNFAVTRQGFNDYSKIIENPQDLNQKKQYAFFKAKNNKILNRLKKLNFSKIAQKNSIIYGYGKADIIEEYTKLYGA